MNMKKEDLWHHCRYYKGEKDNPFDGIDQNKAMLWGYERDWVHQLLKGKSNSPFSSALDEYIMFGLDGFEKTDDTPITLKAMLFNRYAKGSYSMADAVESFKGFYHKYYTKK